MPQLVAYALAAAFTSGVLTTAVWVAAYAITIAAFYAYGSYQRRAATRAANDAFNASLKDRLLMTATTDNPRSRVYGRCRNVDGILFKNTHGANKEFYTFVVAVAGHRIESFDVIYFGDQAVSMDVAGYVTDEPYSRGSVESIGEWATGGTHELAQSPVPGSIGLSYDLGSGDNKASAQPTIVSIVGNVVTYDDPGVPVAVSYQTSRMTSKARVRTFLGLPGQDLSGYLMSLGVPDVTPSHRFEGIACMVITLEYDSDAFPQGVPNFSATIKGARVIDPRTDTTVWTENPALIARDWAMYPHGGNIPLDALYDDMIAAANACDVPHGFVDATGTHVRPMYTCNIVARTDSDPTQVLQEIVSSMAGKYAWVGGRLRVKAGAYTAPVAAVDESWLSGVEPIDIQPGVARNEIVNIYRPSIADIDHDYIVAPTEPIRAQGYIDADGVELPRDIQFLAITDTNHAQHVAGVLLRDARQAMTVKLPMNMRGYPLEVFDTFALSIARFGWVNKEFEILATEFAPERGPIVTAKETVASIFDPDALFTSSDASPNTALPRPWIIQQLTGLVVVSGTTIADDGSIITRARVTWDAIVDAAVLQSGRIEVQYLLASELALNPAYADPSVDWPGQSEAGSAIATTILGLSADLAYVFRGRTINSIGVRSPWSAQVMHVVADLPSVIPDWTDLAGRPMFFRAVAMGQFDTAHPVPPGLYNEDGTLIGGTNITYNVDVLDRATGTILSTSTFDLYNTPAQAAVMRDLLNGLGTNRIVVVRSHAVASTGRLDFGLAAAMYRCGASPAIYGKPNFDIHSAYILIGIPTCGEGNGFESYCPGNSADVTRAYCDVSFLLRGGNLIVTGASTTPGTLADYGYVGTLDATTDLSLIASGNCVIAGNYVAKIGGVSVWDSDARSRDSAYGAAMVSGIAVQTDAHLMFGLNTDPATDSSYASIDFAWYMQPGGVLAIYESASIVTGGLTYAVGDVLLIVYDGSTVRYLQNGIVRRTRFASPGQVLFMDSSFYTPGGALRNIRFGALSSNDWGAVGGSGKPADNATVGAIFGVNIGGQINTTNVPTFVAPGAMGSTEIRDGSITDIKINGIIQSSDYAPGFTGWRINKAGNCEFNNAVFRGLLQAATGSFDGTLTAGALTVAGGALFAPAYAEANSIIGDFSGHTYVSGSSGWELAGVVTPFVDPGPTGLVSIVCQADWVGATITGGLGGAGGGD